MSHVGFDGGCGGWATVEEWCMKQDSAKTANYEVDEACPAGRYLMESPTRTILNVEVNCRDAQVSPCRRYETKGDTENMVAVAS